MAMQFLHLAVYFEKPEAPTVTAIQEVLDQATDWYRYAPNCWLIYTNNGPKIWYKRLKGISGMSDNTSFLICEVNILNRAGWERHDAWEWINKDRAEPSRGLSNLGSPAPME